jgi:hypothetical protein
MAAFSIGADPSAGLRPVASKFRAQGRGRDSNWSMGSCPPRPERALPSRRAGRLPPSHTVPHGGSEIRPRFRTALLQGAGCCGAGRDADATERLTGQLFGAASCREAPPCPGPQRLQGDTIRSDGRASHRHSGCPSIRHATFPDQDAYQKRAGGTSDCRTGAALDNPGLTRKLFLWGGRLDPSGSENMCAVTTPHSMPAREPTRIPLRCLRTPAGGIGSSVY